MENSLKYGEFNDLNQKLQFVVFHYYDNDWRLTTMNEQ